MGGGQDWALGMSSRLSVLTPEERAEVERFVRRAQRVSPSPQISDWINGGPMPPIPRQEPKGDKYFINVYVAAPYSHPEPSVRAERARLATEYATHLLTTAHERGEPLVVYSPLSTTHSMALLGCADGWEFWRAMDVAYLGASRRLHVLTLDGWQESRGVAAEIEAFERMRRPVDFVRWPL
jgi:hypothetical protein